MPKVTHRNIWQSVALEHLTAVYDEQRALELLRFGKIPEKLEDLILTQPPEVISDITYYTELLWKNFIDISGEIDVSFDQFRDTQDRKSYAEAIAAHPRRAMLFQLWDDKPHEHLIWQELKPIVTTQENENG